MNLDGAGCEVGMTWVWVRQVMERLRGREIARQSASKMLGAQGEDLAARYLVDQGYRIVARNVKLTFGEADIVAESPDQTTMVLVEVKTRLRRADQPALSAMITPEQAVDREKRQTLVRIIRHLAASNGWVGKPLRIDVIAIDWHQEGGEARPELRHHVDAVRG